MFSQVLKWGALAGLGISAVSALALYAVARPELGAKSSGDRLDRMKALPYFDGQFVSENPQRIICGHCALLSYGETHQLSPETQLKR